MRLHVVSICVTWIAGAVAGQVDGARFRVLKIREVCEVGLAPTSDPLDSRICAAEPPVVAVDPAGDWVAFSMGIVGARIERVDQSLASAGFAVGVNASNIVSGVVRGDVVILSGHGIGAFDVATGFARVIPVDVGRHLLRIRRYGSMIVGWRDGVLGGREVMIFSSRHGIDSSTEIRADGAVRWAAPFGGGLLVLVQEFLEKPRLVLIRSGLPDRVWSIPDIDLRDADVQYHSNGSASLFLVGSGGSAIIRLDPWGDVEVVDLGHRADIVRWSRRGLWLSRADNVRLLEWLAEGPKHRVEISMACKGDVLAMEVSTDGDVVVVAGVDGLSQWMQVWNVAAAK